MKWSALIEIVNNALKFLVGQQSKAAPDQEHAVELGNVQNKKKVAKEKKRLARAQHKLEVYRARIKRKEDRLRKKGKL